MDNKQEIQLKKHDLDKNIIKSLPILTDKQLEKALNFTVDFIKKNRESHYMLLSHDINYYTIFRTSCFTTETSIANNIFDFLRTDGYLASLGNGIKNIEIDEENHFIEIWIEDICFLLFPCDSFIVNI